MQRKLPGRPFVKNDPRIRTVPGPHPGGGRPSELHRAQCRQLLKEGKLVEWVGKFAEGKPEDIFVTMGGSVKKIPATAINRLRAVQFLAEQGFGAVPKDVTPPLSPEKVKQFEQDLLSIFQKHIPKAAYTKELVQAVLDLSSALFEEEDDA